MDRATLIAAFNATPLEIRPVKVPGWGSFHVRELTLGDMDLLNNAKRAEGASAVAALAMSAASMICDEQGTLLFDVNSKDDIALLSKQGFRRLSKVLEVANTLAEGDDEGNA
jgi:hypothetical protein